MQELSKRPQFDCRIARINPRLDNIPCHYSACSNDHMVADTYRQDAGIGTDLHMIADSGGLPFRFIASGGPAVGKEVVDENHPMSNKTIITYSHHFADKRMRLHPGARTDNNIFLYLAERTDKTIIPDGTTIKIDRLHYSHIFSETHIRDSGVTDLRVIHIFLAV